MNNLRILSIAIFSSVMVGCSGYYDLYPSADYTEEDVFVDITRTQQYLNTAYSAIAKLPNIDLEYYTDNAVSAEGVKPEAVSGLTSESSPIASTWGESLKMIIHINEFLKKGLDIDYSSYDQALGERLKKRITGEAYGLRAYYKWVLLKNFAGPSAADKNVMLGIPLFDDQDVTIKNVNNIARATYQDSYDSIMADIETAFEYIDFKRYESTDEVTGVQLTGRVSQEMLYALKSRVALYAASEAYAAITWEEATAIAYDAIVMLDFGNVIDLQPYGSFNDTKNTDDFWRSIYSVNNALETKHFPPSLFGNGECNPSQGLVDAFPSPSGEPMAAGDPSTARDSRFSNFIFYPGYNNIGETRSVYISSYIGGLDASGGIHSKATRTGYYMKKFLCPEIDLDPMVSATRSTNRFNVIFDRTGLYLDFAEAAAAAYGAKGTGEGMVFTAYDAIKKVRERAGITADTYIDQISGNDEKFLAMVRNERRLEMAFTGERFYDVRRMMLPLETLNTPIMGFNVAKDEDSDIVFYYSEKVVEKRAFDENMYYNPIPLSEIMKSNALVQNYGW